MQDTIENLLSIGCTKSSACIGKDCSWNSSPSPAIQKVTDQLIASERYREINRGSDIQILFGDYMGELKRVRKG